MSLSAKFENWFRWLLPSPFTIAVLLTFVAFVAALFFGNDLPISFGDRAIAVVKQWQTGLWTPPLLVFTAQMMLMLLLGHIVALSKPVDSAIQQLLKLCKNTATAALWVCFFTLVVAFFNWGLGLVFGAIFSRKVGDHFTQTGQKLNYGLIGAAGYSGLMVWHGGFSGSSLIKVAEEGHLASLVSSTELAVKLPNSLPIDQTVFSALNITMSLVLLVVLPAVLYLIGKWSEGSISLKAQLETTAATPRTQPNQKLVGAEKLDSNTPWGRALILLLASMILVAAFGEFLDRGWGAFTPNTINIILLGLALVFHGTVNNFLTAANEAIGGVTGILLQFPLYFGIMGIMKESGLVLQLAEWFTSISTEVTYPIYTFISAGIVNVFVPSGGGQWAIQGPLIVRSAVELGIPLNKCILAMAYGDQLTNMMQPFWALPLLGITKLNAKDILPYSLVLMTVGFVVFMLGLLIF